MTVPVKEIPVMERTDRPEAGEAERRRRREATTPPPEARNQATAPPANPEIDEQALALARAYLERAAGDH